MTCLADNEHLTCTACPLKSHRKQVVPGHGNIMSRIMFVGEAPGKDEDEQGVPFVGPAGKKFNQILEDSGLRREEVFVSNICHCKPPSNDLRPFIGSTIICPDLWLEQEIAIIRPKVIVTLGVTAGTRFFPGLTSAHEMSNTVRAIGGKDWEMYAVGSYHPSYILKARQPWIQEAIKKSILIAKEIASG